MTDDVDARAAVAREVLDGLEEGYHYAALQWTDVDGGREVVEAAWNHERDPDVGSRNDDFRDRDRSKRHRELAIEHQERVQTDEDEGEFERFEAVCEGCGLNTIVEWDGEKGLCDACRAPGGDADV